MTGAGVLAFAAVLSAVVVAAGSLPVPAAVSGGISATAAAAPRPSLDAARRKLAALNERADVITENYLQARLALKTANQRSRSLTARAHAQQVEAERLRHSVAAIAAAAYTGGGGVGQAAAVVTAATPQDMLDKTIALTQLSAQNTARITRYRQARKALAARRAAAAAALSSQRRIADRLKARKSDITRTAAEQKRVLDRLAAARAGNGGDGGDGGGGDRSSRGSDRPSDPGDLPAASGGAGKAIAFAKAQLGKPYLWGGDGPGSYDCSGLTMQAWRAGGVSLPHSSQAQFGAGRR